MIAGFVGGIVVAWLSGSQVAVSGPAAGLTTIVLAAIEQLGNYRRFLVAVVLAGTLQIALGVLKAGTLGAYFPASVIRGVLAAIGLILIMKQIPHAIGYDADYEGDFAYQQSDTENTLSELMHSLTLLSPGAVIVSSIALAILLFWESPAIQGRRELKLLPGPLLAVLWGVLWQMLSSAYFPRLAIADEHRVSLKATGSLDEFLGQFTTPDWSFLSQPQVYTVAVTLAIVASLETLLSLEATDKLDPQRRVAPPNRELNAQGIGNIISGMLGGLPMTAVIVRSSANINAGAHTKVAGFFHGLLLLLTVVFCAEYLNLFPLASLAAILMLTGYKLAKPALFVDMYNKGTSQLVPFVVTVIAILFTDLLKGIAIGVLCGLYYVLRTNFQAAISLTQDGSQYLIHFKKDVSFLNKPLLRELLQRVKPDSRVIIDGSKGGFVDQDILEMLKDFRKTAIADDIAVTIRNVSGFESDETVRPKA